MTGVPSVSEDFDSPVVGMAVFPRAPGQEGQHPGSAGVSPAQTRQDQVIAAYREAVEAAGGRVIEVRPHGETRLRDLEALLLTGGGDIHPERYGQAPHPTLDRVEPERDEFELALAGEALTRGMPVLGICRGAQVMGVATGGQLVQDIPSHVPGALPHASAAGDPPAWHRVRIAPDSRLASILGAVEAPVNSFHHQANSALGPGIRAVAWADDGVIEAVERDGAGFALGVQWHPERMGRDDPAGGGLLAAFVGVAAQYRQQTGR